MTHAKKLKQKTKRFITLNKMPVVSIKLLLRSQFYVVLGGTTD